MQAREQNEDLVFDDYEETEAVWEHESRFKGKPMTCEHHSSSCPCSCATAALAPAAVVNAIAAVAVAAAAVAVAAAAAA